LKFSQNVSNRYLLIVRKFRNDSFIIFFGPQAKKAQDYPMKLSL